MDAKQGPQRLASGPDDDESSGSEDFDDEALRKKAQLLARRMSMGVELAEVCLGDLSVLESKSVSKPVLKDYAKRVAKFKVFWGQLAPETQDGPVVDAALIGYLDHLFFQGEMPHVGEKILASIMALWPRFARHGVCGLPRAFRAMKGWRKVCPAKSRSPLALCVWAALANEMTRNLDRLECLYMLLSLIGYFRPREGLSVKRKHLLAPIRGVCSWWTIMLNPQEEGSVSKVARYEKHGRLATSAQNLPRGLLETALSCEARLEDIVTLSRCI